MTAGLTLVKTLRLLRRGEITAVEIAEASLRLAAEHADLNAFITVSGPGLLDAAERVDSGRRGGRDVGPLGGIPLAVKDNIDTACLPTTAGTPALRGHRPARDADVWDRLSLAGGLLLGKTNMDELAYGVTGSNAAFGQVRNPYDRERVAGGSSAGTAAAVGAGVCPAGLGTDTGGSVRIPAALCGVAGLRPSVGRYSGRGVLKISSTRDTVGPIARSVDDVALLDTVLAGEPPVSLTPADLAGVRLAVPHDPFWTSLDPETERVGLDRLACLRAAGAVLVEADLPQRTRALTDQAGFPIAFYETPGQVTEYLAGHGLDLPFVELVDQVASDAVREMLAGIVSAGPSTEQYQAALLVHRPELRALFAAYVAEHAVEAIVFPTTPRSACTLAETAEVGVGGVVLPTFLAYIANTNPASVIGWAGLTVPAGFDDAGMPVGIEFDGPAGSERRLLAIGAACEALWQEDSASRGEGDRGLR